MRRNGKPSAWKWGLTALLAVGLIGGVALGASASVPASGNFAVSATVTPGSGGGVVVFTVRQETDETVKFSVGGGLEVHGQPCGSFDPDASYSVEMDCYEVAGQLLVDTTVTNADTGLVVYTDTGYPMDRPDTVGAHGAEASVQVN